MTDSRDPGKSAAVESASWSSIDQLKVIELTPGIEMKPFSGKRLMLSFVTLAPNAILPEHTHDNEQAGTVLEGNLRITIGDETRTLRPGDTFLVPSNMPHHASTDEYGCRVIDIFAPPRSDFLPE